MPLELDPVDVAILRSLFKDARKSLREIAREVGVSAPTVRDRIKKMVDAGLIKGFAPVVDYGKLEGVLAILLLKADPHKLQEVTERLTSRRGVMSVYVASGEANLIVKVYASSSRELYDFINSLGPDVLLVSSQVVMKVVKDEQGAAIEEGVGVSVACDYCGQEIKGRPFTLRVGRYTRFFCCPSCLSLFKEKYRRGLRHLGLFNENPH